MSCVSNVSVQVKLFMHADERLVEHAELNATTYTIQKSINVALGNLHTVQVILYLYWICVPG